MRVAFRVRLNGRIPDPDGKHRDEITQEATIEIEDETNMTIIASIENIMREIRGKFYAELNRLGGYNYQEEQQ